MHGFTIASWPFWSVFFSDPPSSTSSTGDLEGLHYPPEHITELIDRVGCKVASRWRAIALQLEFTLEEMDDIQVGYTDNQQRINKVFEQWEDKAPPSSPYTWAHLIRVLEKNAVREHGLAADLRRDLERKPS